MTNLSNTNQPLTADLLKEYYINQNLSASRIGEIFNMTTCQVYKRVQKWKIHKPSELKLKKGNAELKTKESLEKLYSVDNLSITQIGEKLGMTTGAVTSLFKRRGIPISKELRYLRTRRNDELRLKNLREKREAKIEEKKRNRKRNRKSGYHLSDTTKMRIRTAAVIRMSKSQKRTEAEIKMKKILEELGLGKLLKEQEPLIIVGENNQFEGAFLVDFLIKQCSKYLLPVVIQTDSRYHHNLPEIKAKDEKENKVLLRNGYIVLRFWDDEVEKGNVQTSLEMAEGSLIPILIRLCQKEKLIEMCRKYHIDTSRIEENTNPFDY